MEPMTIADIIKAAHDGSPVDVQNAFNNVIQAKMAAAIEARREELAQSLYDSDEELDDDELEDSDVADDDDDVEDLENLDIEEPEDEDI